MTGYEHYDHEQDEDPYLIPGSMCLRNKLCITDTQTLMAAEAEISSLMMAELVSDPVEASFDLAHLCRIHEALFSPVYEWAGTVRQTEISKGGRLFLPYRLIEEKAEQVFQELHRENLLRGSSVKRSPREQRTTLAGSMNFTLSGRVTAGLSGFCLISWRSCQVSFFAGLLYRLAPWRRRVGLPEVLTLIIKTCRGCWALFCPTPSDTRLC